MKISNLAKASLLLTLLILGLAKAADAAEVKLADVSAQEDSKRVILRFTFSTPIKPDVTYFYTHNYVGLRATGLQFSSAQLKRDVPPPSDAAARAYRYVRFVQDKESGEIRLYLTKPLTPADAQVVPYDTYTEVTLLKPAGGATPVAQDDTAPEGEPVESAPAPLPAAEEPAAEPQPVASQPEPLPTEEQAPTLRDGPVEPAAVEEDRVGSEDSGRAAEDSQPEPEQAAEPAQDGVDPAMEPEPIAAPTQQRIGGPSYTEFDLDKVPVRQLVFQSVPFRDAIMELVAGTGYNVVVSDDVDNGEVTLNFNQKQLSLKSALDLLAMGFDLQWSVQPDAIVIKAKP